MERLSRQTRTASARRPPRKLTTIESIDVAAVIKRVRPYTMVPEESLADLADQVRTVLTESVPGAFVECGVWRGGASFLMAELLKRARVSDRKVWLLDSFEGMPPPRQIDGRRALEWAQETDDAAYRDNLRVSQEKVRKFAAALGIDSYTEFVEGWFEHTLPANRGRIGQIAILRIDCDWYSSVRCCLENLYDQVADGGFVTFDDYYCYDGCAVAVHEFLGERRIRHRLESIGGQWGGCEYCYSARLRKGEPNWQWEHRLQLLTRDIASAMPAGQRFVFVDDNCLGIETVAERSALPFLERNGQYWGKPTDDRTAIRELERVHHAGVNFIAFAWPAFWWLDSYTGFLRYLRARYRCTLENERLIVFDLRP
jgi:O-methyltransferase